MCDLPGPGLEPVSPRIGRRILNHCTTSEVPRKGILTPATTWVNLEVVTLSERSQTQRTNSVGFHFCEVPGGVRFITTESRTEGVRGWGGGQGTGSEFLMGTESQLGMVETFWTWMCFCNHQPLASGVPGLILVTSLSRTKNDPLGLELRCCPQDLSPPAALGGRPVPVEPPLSCCHGHGLLRERPSTCAVWLPLQVTRFRFQIRVSPDSFPL